MCPENQPPNWSLIFFGASRIPMISGPRFISDLMTGVIRLVLRCFFGDTISHCDVYLMSIRTETPISFLKARSTKKMKSNLEMTLSYNPNPNFKLFGKMIPKSSTTTAQSGGLHHDGWCLLFTSRELICSVSFLGGVDWWGCKVSIIIECNTLYIQQLREVLVYNIHIYILHIITWFQLQLMIQHLTR